MREILFRGKRVDNGEWIFWNVFGHITTQNGRQRPITEKTKRGVRFYTDIYSVKIRKETVEQYTGLTDKNGRKIFEGDIVELTYYTLPEERKVMAEVAYEEESAAFVLYSFGTENKGICGEICNTNKVIGNIYDNPEMLED